MRPSRAQAGGLLVALAVLALLGCSTGVPPDSALSAMTSSAPPTDAPPSTEPVATPSGGLPSHSPGAVDVPGTHIAMVPPAGFELSGSFDGFEHESGASIVVLELPGSYDEVIPGMTDEGFAGQGITVTSRSDVTIEGRPAVLVEGTQTTQGLEFGKVLLVAGEGELTIVLTGNYPIAEEALGAAIREAELSLSIDPERTIDPQASLTFSIVPEPPLRFAGAFVNAAIYNTSGTVPSADVDEPFFIVAPSLGGAVPGDLEAFALKRLVETATITDIQVETTKSITIAGRPGIEHVAKAVRASGSGEVVVYQVLLGGGDDYILMSGICDADRSVECLAMFAATAKTYEPRP
jgi:hypothetical protein